MDLHNSAEICRKIAQEGIVLLENDHILPSVPSPSPVAVFGIAQKKMRWFGGGAVSVNTAPYYIDVPTGLQEAGFQLDKAIAACYAEDLTAEPDIPDSILQDAASRCEMAVFVLTRYSGEGEDHDYFPGNYLLTAEEQRLISSLDRAGFRKTVFVLNIGCVMDLSWLRAYHSPRAALLIHFPGMEGGRAVADILTGAANPSGKLTDTYPLSGKDYPGMADFRDFTNRVEYKEDIYVGYRYFETFCPEKVQYPFGFGLSYTQFQLKPRCIPGADNALSLSCVVQNTGLRPGKEVVQWYVSRRTPLAERPLERPVRQLVAYGKTPELAPGENHELTWTLSPREFASFDDRPDSPTCGCWILEAGEYDIYAGDSVRNATAAFTYTQKNTEILRRCGILLQGGLPLRLSQKDPATQQLSPLGYCGEYPSEEKAASSPRHTLQDVAQHRISMEQFVGELPLQDLISLLHARGATFPHGTAGIGNLPQYGIPNVQTCDSSAGLHITTEATCFPCGVMLAATWNKELQYQFGRALSQEAEEFGCDILLGPGVNLHRTPFSGRNAEYYSEDPFLSGWTAVQVIHGMQEHGTGATLKHIAANNREMFRRESDSIVSERALRELYLRAFEIAIREAQPLCLMAAYNRINGTQATGNRPLLTDIVRKEWGYQGVIMTDWRCLSSFLEEVRAGNNLRMPLVPDDREYGRVAEAVEARMLPRKQVETLAAQVLSGIMRTRSFRDGRMPKCHTMPPGASLRISALDFSEVSATRTRAMPCTDPVAPGKCHGRLCKDYGGNEVRIHFFLQTEKERDANLTLRYATPAKRAAISCKINGVPSGEIPLEATMPQEEELRKSFAFDTWSYSQPLPLRLPSGCTDLEIRISDPDGWGASLNFLELQ